MEKKSLNRLKKLDLLIVDDNEVYLNNISKGLENFFSKIYTASTYDKALSQLENNPHILLLDIELSKRSGIELAQELKTLNKNCLIIFISGFSDKEYLLNAIKLNVVDYIIKPATLPILMESFEKALDALGDKYFDKFQLAEDTFFFQTTQTLKKDDVEISLGAKERKLLTLFVENHDFVVTKEKIANTVWPNTYMSESALKNLISELRKKVGKKKIQNIPGAGWKLETNH